VGNVIREDKSGGEREKGIEGKNKRGEEGGRSDRSNGNGGRKRNWAE